MKKINILLRIPIIVIGIALILGLIGLIGSSSSIARGIDNSTTDMIDENRELIEISSVYGDFMNELYSVTIGESIDFKSLPFDSIRKFLNKITDLYPNVSPVKINDTIGIKPYISSEFGWRIHPTTGDKTFHTGVDINMPLHTNIYSTMTGKVIEVKYTTETTNGQGYGNYVVINNNLGFKTLYAHLSTISVIEGQKINKGQLVGNLGKTGNATGPCLHYEIFQNNERLNPMDSLYLNHSIKLLANQ